MTRKIKPLVKSLGTLILTAGLLSGCGGGDGAGTCGKVQPCGGSIVGNWKVSQSCVTTSAVALDTSAFCPTATVAVSKFDIAGMGSYNADMTYSIGFTASATVKMVLPPSCLMNGGITLTCAQFNDGIQALFMSNPDPAIKSFSCSASGANCACTVVSNPQPSTETGTYVTTGNVLTTTDNAGAVSAESYCVQGKTLHIISDATSMGMGMMGSATITGDIVLTKQ